MSVVCHDRTGGISVVFLCWFLAFHQRNKVLGSDRNLFADSGGCGMELSVNEIGKINSAGLCECPNCGRIVYKAE